LISNNYSVVALTRSPAKIEKISQLGAKGILGDIRNPAGFHRKLKNIDLIVLLAMPGVIPGKRVTAKIKDNLRKETNDFFRNTLNLAKELKVPVILPGGTSYRTGENEIADETWPIRRKGLTEIGADTDEMIQNAITNDNLKVIQLLYGKIYGNGGLFRFMYNMMEKGRFKVIGNGENYIPNIYAGDAAKAIVLAIKKLPFGEKFIICDDVPVTQKNFAYYMSELMDKKKPGKIPAFIIKLILGKDLYEVISMNCKVTNEKAKKVLGWQPEFPSCKEGLKSVLKDMNNKLPYFQQ
jgi:nucleoside-diphosphate-sugar epimerase